MLTPEHIAELRALGDINLALGGPSFMSVVHRDFYAPLVELGLVEWVEPHSKMGEQFAETRLTGKGARVAVDDALGDTIAELGKPN